AMSTGLVATLFLTRLIATIQVPTRGMMLQLPICLQAAPRPLLELTTADGCLQAATSTSPSVTTRSPGTPLPTRGLTCQTWYRRAITSKGQRQGNPSTRSQAALRLALVPTTTSSTP